MRRFMVHLVTEIDFVDGDDASDVAAQISRRPFRTRRKGCRSGPSRTPGSKVSRSQKLKLSSSNPPTFAGGDGLQPFASVALRWPVNGALDRSSRAPFGPAAVPCPP